MFTFTQKTITISLSEMIDICATLKAFSDLTAEMDPGESENLYYLADEIERRFYAAERDI